MSVRPIAVLTSLAMVALVPVLAPAPSRAAGDGPAAVTKDVTVKESNEVAVLRPTLAHPATRAIRITWSTEADTATAADYGASTGTATIKEGQRSTKIKIPIVDDKLAEAVETFNVLLLSKRARMKPGLVIVSIKDDELGPETITGTIHGHTNDTYESTHIVWNGDVTLTYSPESQPGLPWYWPTYLVTGGTVTWSATGTCVGAGTLSGSQLEGHLEIHPGDVDPTYGTTYLLLISPSSTGVMTASCPDGQKDIAIKVGRGGSGGFLAYGSKGPLWANTDNHTPDLRSYTGNFYPAEFTCGADWDLTGTGDVVLPSPDQ